MSYTNSDKPRPVRSRALTERGRLYKIGECQRRRSQLEAKIRTQLLVVETLIEDNRVDKLSEEIQLTENLFTEYSRVHSKCQILIQSGVEEDDAHSTESIDRRFNSIRRKVSELLDSSSKSERKTDRQSKSKSLKSSRKGSSIRSIASHIAKEKARIAELQVEAEFTQEQQRLEQDARNLTLRLEMAKAEAKLQAYQSSDIEDCSQNLDDLPAEVDKSQKVADYINRHLLSVNDVSRQNEGIVPPVDQSVDGGDHQDQDHQEEDQPARKSTKVNARTLEVKLGRRQNVPQSIQREDNPFAVRPPIDQMYGLTHLINHLQAPTVEIDTFSGNCIDYPYFITTFIEVVETRISDPRGRLIRLLKYLDEEAKELVQACVYLPADEGYKKARQLLEKNYGDQYRILSEYRKEFRSWLCLPKVYSRPFIPVDKEEIPTPSKVAKWKYLDKIHPHLQHDDDAEEVGILIGANCPRALEPLETIPSQGSGPYAFRSVLGWCVTGPIINKVPSTSEQRCNFVSIANNNIRFVMQDEIKEQGLGEMMLKMFQQDFSENNEVGESENLSINDKKFLRIMDENVKLIDGHYQLPLPFKEQIMDVPNNKSLAIKRVFSLKKKLQTNKKMHEDYCTFMKNIFDKGFAEKCDSSSENGKTWYLPHHGVYHPKKPNKIRVVFDCSAKYGGVSLNSLLLQGPDLTNQIIGVLTRFREDQVALVGDIESMFYQVRVPKDQRDMLRFVWWPEGDLSAELQEYQMCVHLFGGTHSPSTCNYALRKTAKDNTEEFGEEAASTLINNFYVDDMLKSAPDVPSTLHLLKNVKQMCAAGGFPLSKFVTSSREVLQTISSKERSKEVKDINFDEQILPIERALGVSWCIENDSFCFRIVLKDAPLTRRGILASVSSVYDPLGFGAPFILPVKQLLQQLCAEQKDWDDKISGSQRATWERWRNSLHLLTDVRIRRCIRPEDFGEVCDASLHHFSDAATGGYGQVSYLRLVNARDEVHCCFMMGKARVTPLKPVTVPRLELTAATTSTKVATQLKKELTLKWSYKVFWTDSQEFLIYHPHHPQLSILYYWKILTLQYQ